MWADIETRVDYLNYQEIAEVAGEILMNRSMRPVSVGIFGTWGTGKSSLLNLIEDDVRARDEDGVLIIRFDAWLYQGFDDARAALMDVIARTLYEQAKADAGLKETALSLMKRVRVVRALGLGAEILAAAHGIPMFGAGAKAVSAVGNFVGGKANEEDAKALKEVGNEVGGLIKPAEQKSPPEEIDAFRAEFGELLRKLDKTMIVFVDNLDRCLPTQTIHTLEALRLFLFMEQSAFVVAADEQMVRDSVSQYFRGADDRHVKDYLDKLIQVPIRVPRSGVAEIRAYLFMLLAESVVADAAARARLRQHLESNLRRSWIDAPLTVEEVTKAIGTKDEKLSSSFDTADKMATLLANASLVEGNPRIVKRMLNVVRLRTIIAVRRGMSINEELVAKFALFERCVDTASINKLYALINEAPVGQPHLIKELELACDDPERFGQLCPEEWKKHVTFLLSWFELKPSLQTDLRPLVYLSRDITPIRSSSSNLSKPGADAVIRLRNAVRPASRVAQEAIKAIPEGEHASVMRELVSELKNHQDWNVRPQAFIGAQMLADNNAEAAVVLASYLASLQVKMGPWFKAAVSGKGWFQGGE
jgi:Predicted P-loop ATPase